MTMPSEKISGGLQFSLIWLMLNAAGWGIGFGLEQTIMHNAGLGVFTNLFALLVAGGVIGLAQWLGLRWLMAPIRAGSQGIAWVILTIFGYTAGFLTAGMVTGLVGEGATPEDAAKVTFLAWGLVGLVTGGLQWMELQFFTRGAAWWVGANALGYAVGGTMMSVIRIEEVAGPKIYILAGLVAGAVTLVAISRLRRRVLLK